MRSLLAVCVAVLLLGCQDSKPVVTDVVIETPVIVIPPVEIIRVPVEVAPIIDIPMPEIIVQDPIIVEPIVDDPIIEEPIVIEPPVEEPIIEDPIIDEPVIIPTEYTATFTGRIIYESGLPVTDNLIMTVGDDWENFSYTDGEGNFTIDVVGDSKFLFSALSPFTVDVTYCEYITLLVVEEGTTSGGFDCNITTPIDICIENYINYP